MSKNYGLILPTKNSSLAPPKADFTKPSVFGSESDSDSDTPARAAKIGPGVNEKRQAKKIQEKALKEDPTVFQYDELYDEIENKRDEEKKAKTSEVKKPKYIGRLLQCAERRKVENERRLERLVQKERELEGEEFKDKESFVTTAYRKKLEEHKLAEEREKREDYLEAIGDVTRQQDLGGFYRHLYEQKLGPKESKPDEKERSKSPSTEPESEPSNKIKSSKPRVYRKRRSSEEDNSPTQEKQNSTTKKAHLQSNLDADSDFSIDSSSSDSEEEPETLKNPPTVDNESNKVEVVVKEEPIDGNDHAPVENVAIKPSSQQPCDAKLEDIKKEEASDGPIKATVEKKDKKDIWKKRTVGEVFDAALQRYYERKASRNG